MYIEKASRFFDLIRNRDLPNTRFDLEFIVILIIFLGGYRGALPIYLLWKSTNIQYSAPTPR